jgi:hypothetical protein
MALGDDGGSGQAQTQKRREVIALRRFESLPLPALSVGPREDYLAW